MEALWYGLLAAMLGVYASLDGFDLGVGIVHLWVARSDSERREAMGAIGPVWNGNEVWLIAAGGTLVLAFPKAYASGFSGFYLPLMIVLWLLVLRGLSLELRSHLENPLWAAFWDVTFTVGSALLAIVFAAAVANLLRGVPVDESGYFSLPLFAGGHRTVGVLDLYTVSAGLLGLVLLGLHGAIFLGWRTTGPVRARARTLARRGGWVLAALWAGVTWGTFRIAPELLDALLRRPLAWAALALTCVAVGCVVLGIRRDRWGAAFCGSLGVVIGVLGCTATTLFPVLIKSTIPAFTLTAHQAAASEHGLSTALRWWLVGVPLACGYFMFLVRTLRRVAH